MTGILQLLSPHPDKTAPAGSGGQLLDDVSVENSLLTGEELAEGFTDFTRLLEAGAGFAQAETTEAPVEQPAFLPPHIPELTLNGNQSGGNSPVALPGALLPEALTPTIGIENTDTALPADPVASGAALQGDVVSVAPVQAGGPAISVPGAAPLPATNLSAAPERPVLPAPGSNPARATAPTGGLTAQASALPLSSSGTPETDLSGRQGADLRSPVSAGQPQPPLAASVAEPSLPAPPETDLASLAEQQTLKSQDTARLLTQGSQAVSPGTDFITSQTETPLAAAETRSAATAPSSTGASVSAVNTPSPTGGSAVQQIANAMASANMRGDKLEVRLDPPDLGRVYIDFNMDGDRIVSATLSAEQSDTGSLMRRHMDILLKELTNAGFPDVDLSFSDTAREKSDGPGTGSTQFSQGSIQTVVTEEAAAKPLTPVAGMLSDGIDLRL